MIFEVGRLTVEEAKGYEDLWDTIEYHFPHLSEEDRAKIMSFAQDLCPNCFDGNADCTCKYRPSSFQVNRERLGLENYEGA